MKTHNLKSILLSQKVSTTDFKRIQIPTFKSEFTENDNFGY